MRQERLAPGQTLETYAGRLLVELAEELQGFEIEEVRETTLAGSPALEQRFTWEGRLGLVAERRVLVAVRETVYTVIATWLKSEARAVAPMLDRMIASVRIEPGDAHARASTAPSPERTTMR